MEYELCIDTETLNIEGIEKEIILEPMTFEEKLVYFNLFGKKRLLKEFGEENLPPRVYEILDWIKQNNKLEEGHFFVADSETMHDPILYWKKSEYTWDVHSQEIYLLARWGRALVPFKELRDKASKRMTMKLKELAENQVKRFNKYRKDTDYHIEYLLEFGNLDGISIADLY